nr:uncharacterized protein LOC111417674 isoform X1 [Onthophagus taurus]
MNENEFVVTDIDFENLAEMSTPTVEKINIPFEDQIIKEEIVKEDDILLFTQAEVEEELSGNDRGVVSNTSSFEIVDNIANTVQIPENASFNYPFSEEQLNQLNQLLNGTNFISKNNPGDGYENFFTPKIGGIKMEGNYSHFIKYKVQEGKHTKVWQCGICSKEFGHQYILMRHLPTHTDERKFQCNTCGKAFRQMSTLSQHRAIHSAERPYICEICQKTFNRVSTLISHRKTHTGHKPHRCHLCNKAFHQKGNLRNHIFTHTNERPYKCDVCSKGFNQMSNLMCHKLKAHQRADKPRYTCQTCGKDFQKRMGLRNHEQYEHGDGAVANPAPGQNGGGGTNSTSKLKYTNGVLVDPINTAAMQHALATNQTPFALLRPLNGIPVLVRVLAAGDKQMLVPATAEDLKKHGQITITEKPQDDPDSTAAVIKTDTETNPDGSTVQIKIPVVATVVQRCGKDGNMCMDVESPGPSSDTLQDASYLVKANQNLGDQGIKPNENTMAVLNSNDVQFFDLTPKNANNFNFDSTVADVFNQNHLQFTGEVIQLDEANNELNNEVGCIYSEEMFGNNVFEVIFKLLFWISQVSSNQITLCIMEAFRVYLLIGV